MITEAEKRMLIKDIMERNKELFAALAAGSPETRDPTLEKNENFIWAFRKKSKYLKTDKQWCGKWLIFPSDDKVFEYWRTIQNATVEGILGGVSKVSTAKSRPGHDSYVICVYTYDSRDETDKKRVHDNIVGLLGIAPARYKTDEETRKDIVDDYYRKLAEIY